MEWKILKGAVSNAQKALNQWQHMYHIHIHGITYEQRNHNSDVGKIIIVLTRERKEKQPWS